MKARRFHKYIRCIALLLAVAALCACARAGEVAPPLAISADMPPAPSEAEGQVRAFEAKLYFVSEDGLRLVPETRDVAYTGNISHAEAAIAALIDGPTSDVLRASMPRYVQLDRVELSLDACNIYCSALYTPDADDLLVARAALAATVYAAEGIDSINLYINGTERGYHGHAMGATSPIAIPLDAYLVGIRQEYETLYNEAYTEAGSYETRTGTLYFTDLSGKLLIARNTVLNYDRSEDKAGIAALLISKLLDGDASLEPVLPPDLTFMRNMQPQVVQLLPLNPQSENRTEEGDQPHPVDEVVLTEEQTCIIELRFAQPNYDFDADILCGAITLTLTGYIPGVAGVAIYIEDDDGKSVNLKGGDAYFTRDDFELAVGANIRLPYPDADGSILHRVSRAVPGARMYDPMVRLSELFKGPADPGILYPLFGAEDVESVYVVGDMAVLNWRPGFAAKLQTLLQAADFTVPQSRRERLFLFSVVNAITEIPGIQRVWMLEDGKKLGIIDDIYLGNALLRNPGILIDD
ncbi:MAG: GerMN domain-containing protein [Christensenellaceae bacterium]|jgi:hypothetical protein|nr:GerMN domain-containing protein [Christensenellaceae bacterium]